MRRELVSVLCTHLCTGFEHPLVHFSFFAHACVELKGVHARFLQNMLHHTLFGVYMDRRLRYSIFTHFVLFFLTFSLLLFNFYSLNFSFQVLII